MSLKRTVACCSTLKENVEIGVTVKRTNVVYDTVARKDFAREDLKKGRGVNLFYCLVSETVHVTKASRALAIRQQNGASKNTDANA